ncbi:MAG: hypothetical protein HY454_01140 [Parcubacteria group bacterium]|nr:hypothetical protein [Parcubacteria group bacterium]
MFLTTLTVIGLVGNVCGAFGQTPPALANRFAVEATATANGGRPLTNNIDGLHAMVWLSSQNGHFPIWGTQCWVDDYNPTPQLCAREDGILRFNPWWLTEDIFRLGSLSLEVWGEGRIVQRVNVPKPIKGISRVGTIVVPDAPVSVQVVGVASISGGVVNFTVRAQKIVSEPLPIVVRAYVSTSGGGGPWAEVELRPKKVSAPVDETGVATAYLYSTEFEYSIKLPAYVPVGMYVLIRAVVEDPNDPFTRWGQAYNWTQK